MLRKNIGQEKAIMSDTGASLILQSCNKILKRSYAATLSKLVLYERDDISFDEKVRHYDKECEGAQIIYALLTTKMKGIRYKIFDKLKQHGEFREKQNLFHQKYQSCLRQSGREKSFMRGLQNKMIGERMKEGSKVREMMEKNRKSEDFERQQSNSELSWKLIHDIEKAAQKKADRNLVRRKIMRKLENLQRSFDEYLMENDGKSIETESYFSMGEKYALTNNEVTHRFNKRNSKHLHSFQFY